jgi:hypothetical protein
MRNRTILAAIVLAALFAAAPPVLAQDDMVPVAGPEACPDRMLSAEVVEGVYGGVECGDYCYLTLTRPDGREETYGASGDVQDFQAPIGTKVRAAVALGVFLKFYDGEGYFCSKEGLALRVERVK